MTEFVAAAWLRAGRIVKLPLAEGSEQHVLDCGKETPRAEVEGSFLGLLRGGENPTQRFRKKIRELRGDDQEPDAAPATAGTKLSQIAEDFIRANPSVLKPRTATEAVSVTKTLLEIERQQAEAGDGEAPEIRIVINGTPPPEEFRRLQDEVEALRAENARLKGGDA